MPSVPNVTSIPAPRVPFVDPATGLIANEWYRFLLNLFTLTGSGSSQITLDDLMVGPPVQESVSSGGGGGTGDVVGPSSSTDNAIVRFDGTTGKLIQNSSVTLDDAGNIINPDSVQFSGTVPATQPIGTMWFDGTTDTLNFQQNNITQQVGEELFIYGRADEAITDGQVIAVTGSYGTTGVVRFAPAPIGTTNQTAIIGVATEAIAKNAFGRITAFGTIHGLSTSPSFADGDVLWYDPTVVGGYTKTEPVAPNIKVQVGIVTKAAGGTNGSIAVKVIPGSSLGGTDSNVQFGTLANKDLIVYDSALGYWKNSQPSTIGLGTVTSVSGTGSVNGITLTGTVTSSGNLTLGGTLGSIANSQLTYSSITINGNVVSLGGTVSVGTVTSVGATAPIASSGGTTPTISISQSNSTTNGYLSSTDWNTFNNKQPAGTYVTSVGATSPVASSGGTTPTISMPQATGSVSGYLSSTDWTTFNNKGSGTVTSVTGTAPIASSGGATPAISISQATTSTNGYLSSTDWNTFNNKQPAGTYVTSVTGTSPITSSGGTTPALSLASGYGDTQNPYASKTANYFLAAPNGAAGVPTFRAMVAADVPTLNQNTTGTASNVTGTVAIANGGTGQTAKTAAYNALSPNTTKGDIEVFDGTNNVRLPVGTNTYVLTADSTTASGIKWAAASGGSSNITTLGMWENANTISANYSITSGNNAVSAGPVTIATGVTVTVPTGSNWTIV